MSDSDISIKILIGLLLTIFFYEVYPFVRVIIMKKNYDEKQVKKMSLWNSIIVGLLFAIVSFIIDENAPMNLAPAVLYYFVNKLVWVNKGNKDVLEKPKKKENKQIEEDVDEDVSSAIIKDNKKQEKTKKENFTFICSECGAIVKYSDKKCPKCGERFDEVEETSSSIDVEKMAADLNKLKKLLDNQIITKEEFDIEKKKILNKYK